MRRALIIGIDDYIFSPLGGCVNDALLIENALSRHEDGSPNFACKLLLDREADRNTILESVNELFAAPADIALLYFSGHGGINNLGGYLIASDSAATNDGIRMNDIIEMAQHSPVKEVVIILDCCFSGAIGQLSFLKDATILREGNSILAASRPNQVSIEEGGNGLFTRLVNDALHGGAADTIGNVTIAGIYAYVDELLDAWEQRPIFKSYVSKLQPIRKCEPAIALTTLRKLTEHFPEADYEFPLDSSFEPDAEPKHEENEKIFAMLQKYRAARLLVPVDEEHMYFAAIRNKSCKLTPLGKFYWNKVRKSLL